MMPVDCANRHPQLGSQGGLGDIRIMFDLFEQDELAGGIGLGFLSYPKFSR